MDDSEEWIDWQHLPDDLADDLREAVPAAEPAPSATGSLREQEAHSVERALAEAKGNLSEAARRLGISRNTLYRRLRAAPGTAT